MAGNNNSGRFILGAQSVPILPRHIKLKHDEVRDRWILLAPERVLTPDDIAVTILTRLDGIRTVQDVAQELSEDYDAPVETILRDVIDVLQDLADKGYLKQ